MSINRPRNARGHWSPPVCMEITSAYHGGRPHLSEILAPDVGPLLGGMGMFLPAPAPDMTLSTAVAMGSGL